MANDHLAVNFGFWYCPLCGFHNFARLLAAEERVVEEAFMRADEAILSSAAKFTKLLCRRTEGYARSQNDKITF